MTVDYIDIRNGAEIIARVGYDEATKTLRVKDLAHGAKKIRVWSPKEKDFRSAVMMDDERCVDVQWTKDS